MRAVIFYIFICILGLTAGAGYALNKAGLIGKGTFANSFTVNVDGWQSDWSIGAPNSDPYTRARVARHGLLALQKQEAVYFTRATDANGDVFRENCMYRMQGTGQDALWWSITLYDGESRLPMNDGLNMSIDATNIGNTANWSALITPGKDIADLALQEGEFFLSSEAAGTFDMTLRLYRPSAALLENPNTHLNPPQIETLNCQGDAA